MKKENLPENMEIEVIDSENFRLLFHGEGPPYDSEIYWKMPDESFEEAAMLVCLRFDWINNPPNADTF